MDEGCLKLTNELEWIRRTRRLRVRIGAKMKEVKHLKVNVRCLRLSFSILVLFLILSGSTWVRAGLQENSPGSEQEDAQGAAKSEADTVNSPPFEIKISTFGWDEFCGTNKLPGFKDPNYFTRLYTEKYGYPPSQEREQGS